MNYKKIYDDLMQSRLLMKEERIKAKKAGEYFEAHHIVPVCMGGEGKSKEYNHPNLVLLTGREHYIVHALLFFSNRNRELAFAFKVMCTSKQNGKRKYNISARLYESLKVYLFNQGISEETRRKISIANQNKVVSEETREKMRKANIGKKLSEQTKEKLRQINLGKTYSEETREKKRQKMIGRFVSEETREKLRQINLGNKNASGRIVSDETRRKIGINSGNSRRGKKLSPEHIEKVRQANLGKKRTPEQIERMKLVWVKRKENMTKCHTSVTP